MRQTDSTSFVYHRYCKSTRRGLNQAIPITIHGLIGDDIFELVRKTNSFYEADLLGRIGFLMGRHADVIVDVGANIGNHTLYFSKVLGAKVICVEPNPAALVLLQKNLEMNEVTGQVTIVKAAASDHSGSLRLENGPLSNLGMAKVMEAAKVGSIEIASITLDEMISSVLSEEDARISLVKIDVEGFEQNVLRGALKTIAQHGPIIVVEAATPESHRAIESMLARFGYHCLGPFASTPTYIFCQSHFLCLAATFWWFLARAARFIVRKCDRQPSS